MRTAFAILLTVVVAIVGGALSVSWVLAAHSGLGALSIGGWTAYPRIGTADADPYAKARIAREGLLALGPAEGLAFTATRDSSGAALLAECSYRIEGQAPQARFWTLFASAPQATPGALGAINSRAILHEADGRMSVTVSPHIAPGNWLRTAGSGPMELVMSVYDAGVATGAGVGQPAMPAITRTGCDA